MTATLILLNLCGSVALLLFGLSQIKSGIFRAFGARLQHFLAVSTRTGPRALLAGFGVTLALQSSTATAILAASFAQRKMLTSRAGLIVMLGANVGTAVTAWVVSFHLGWVSPLAILAGYVLSRGQTTKRSGLGKAIMGIGLLLLALQLLEVSSAPMRDSPALAAFLLLLGGAPIVAVGFSALIAFLSTSSLAAVIMIGSLTASSGLDLDLVVPLILGANIGGALPPILATMGSSPSARRLAFGNLFVRGFGALMVLILLGFVPDQAASPLFEIARSPVSAHLVFNLLLLGFAWPFCGAIASMFKTLIPDAQVEEGIAPRSFSDADLATPVVALASATREVLNVGDLIERMLNKSLDAFQSNDANALQGVADLEKQVDLLQQEVKVYVSRVASHSLSEKESRRAIAIIDYVINLEHVGDIIEKGLAPMLQKRAEKNLTFSQDGYDELLSLFSLTLDNLKSAQTVFATEDFNLARMMIEAKVGVRQMEKKSAQAHIERLRDGRRESLETSSLHLDILRDLKRINAHVVSVAHPVLDDSGVLAESRLTSQD